MSLSKRKTQRGFTLIEIAVVLVIIGLLLGGVLRGQELINSARAKNLVQEITGVATMVYSYQDRFQRLPGDDPAANDHVGGTNATTPATAVRGNGRIEGSWDSRTTTDESVLFWQHVRMANLANGATDPTAGDFLPANALGGVLGVTSDAPNGMAGAFFVCSGGMSGRFARQIEATLDNGDGATGSTRIYPNGDTTQASRNLTAADDDTANFVVCVAN